MISSPDREVSPERPLIGTVLTIPGASVAEMFSEPFDVIWIDLEHAALSTRDAQEMIVGAQAAGAVALVRLPHDAIGTMVHVLDAGADGLVLADVPNAQTARDVLDRIRHPPAGSRGWGPRRLSLRHRTRGADPVAPIVWAQIESRQGIADAAEIASVDGIEALIVGTADLSFALGTPLGNESQEIADALGTIRVAAESSGVLYGVAGALTTGPPSLTEGASALIHSTDARMAATAVDAAAAFLRTRREER